jgi:hypothetical protein
MPKEMKYQLVIQFHASDAENFGHLVELEEKIIGLIGNQHIVDGHDFGSGEMNLFINTNDPKKAFEKIKKVLLSEASSQFKAAFREVEASSYTILWPERYEREFKVI